MPFSFEELGGKKYAGMAVILVGAETEKTDAGKVLSKSPNPFKTTLLVKNGSLLGANNITVNPRTIATSTPEGLPDDVFKCTSPIEALDEFFCQIDESPDAFPCVTNINEVKWDILSSANLVEKMGELFLLDRLLNVNARDPRAQNSSVDKVASKVAMEEAVKGLDLSAVSGEDALIQSKPAAYVERRDYYLCRHFGKLVGDKKKGKYSRDEFDVTNLASLRLDNTNLVLFRFWVVSTESFFKNECGSVFFDPASGKKNIGAASLYLHDYDKDVESRVSEKNLSWDWMANYQLLRAKCGCGAPPFFLLSGVREEHATCHSCGSELSLENEFAFDVGDRDVFPDGLSEALCKAVAHIKHDRARGIADEEEGEEDESEEEESEEEEDEGPSTSSAPLPKRARK